MTVQPVTPILSPVPQEIFTLADIAKRMIEHRVDSVAQYAVLANPEQLIAFEIELAATLLDMARSFEMTVDDQRLVIGALAVEVMGV